MAVGPHVPPLKGVGDVPRRRPLASGIKTRAIADGSTVYDVQVRRSGRRWSRTCYSLVEAERFRADAIAASRGDIHRDPLPGERAPTSPSETLNAVALDQIKRMSDGVLLFRGRPYKRRSIRVNADALRLDVLPALGHMPIGSITRRDVKRFLDELASSKPHRARKARSALAATFRIAIEDEVVEDSPMRNVPSYSVPTRREWVYFHPEYLEPALAWGRSEDSRLGRSLLYPAWGTAIHAGLRTGEILGLRWGPLGIDFERQELHVSQKVSSERDPRTANYSLEPPKNDSTWRVGMSEDLQAILMDHRDRVVELGGDVSDGSMVFIRPEGLYYSPNRTLIEPWKKCMKAICHPQPWPHIHDHRHAFVSMALEVSGGNVHAAAALVGHRSPQQVLHRYGHALDATKRAIPDLIAEARRAIANPAQDPSES